VQRGHGVGPGLRRARGGEQRLDRPLVLELGAAGVAVRDVGQRPVALAMVELAVGERGEAVTEVRSDVTPSAPSSGRRPGARCSSASRSWARPRWMRLRTVPSLMPSVAEISS
jgi:hypothetical protein